NAACSIQLHWCAIFRRILYPPNSLPVPSEGWSANPIFFASQLLTAPEAIRARPTPMNSAVASLSLAPNKNPIPAPTHIIPTTTNVMALPFPAHLEKDLSCMNHLPLSELRNSASSCPEENFATTSFCKSALRRD